MKLAIMQPYLFPYIGYFQLISAVDKFVVYDDVNFIKGGWINRNNLLINKKVNMFTLPLDKPSPFTLINETQLNCNFYESWKLKFLRSIEQSYKKAPFYAEVYFLVENILDNKDNNLISKLAVKAIKSICGYLTIDTEILETSAIYKNNQFKAQQRVLDICAIEKASQYINVSGGLELYSKEVFKEKGIQLNFIKAGAINYKQFGNEFVPWLSIIDVLMFNSVEEVKNLINQYELI
ncbi:WbqC family protein [Flavobacterium sp. PL12]|uniref:WbqC family protein n=1 Tax=Flavobacterium sp. PL12 TaxID=3071718 RepID=UPI00319E25BE